jgi:hypothetical protein
MEGVLVREAYLLWSGSGVVGHGEGSGGTIAGHGLFYRMVRVMERLTRTAIPRFRKLERRPPKIPHRILRPEINS